MRLQFVLKKFLIPVILFASILLIVTGCSSEKDDDTYEIRLALTLPEDAAASKGAMQFKENVEDKTNNKINVEVFPNAELHDSENDQVEATQLGNIEMGATATITLENFEPKFGVLGLPYLFESREEAYNALDGDLGKELNSSLEEKKLISLGYGDNGFRSIFNNKRDVQSPDDVSGLKLRVIESKLHEDILGSFGASTDALGLGETYSAIQQGTVDGLDSEISIAYDNQFQEVVDHLTLTEHTFMPITYVINKEFLESLPDDLANIVEEEGEKAAELAADKMKEEEKDKLEELKDEIDVTELTSEQQESFREATKPVYDKYKEKIGEDVVELAEQSK